MDKHRTYGTGGNARRRQRPINSWRIFLRYVYTLSLCPMVVGAQAQIVPYVAAQTEYDSNVLDLPSPAQALLDTGSSRRDDFVQRFLGGVNANYQINQQNLHGAVEGRRFDYLHFSQLDHYEYLVDGGLDWALSDDLDGAVDIRQERSMTPFAALSAPQLELQLDRAAGARVNLMVTPEWLVQGGIKNHELDSPIPGVAGFGSSENSVYLAVRYLNIEPFSAGLYGQYLRGNYLGIAGPHDYNQATLDLTSTYVISGLSNVKAEFGYTERNDQTIGSGSISGYNGSLSYMRKLSEKTAVNLQLFRTINSGIAGSGSSSGAVAGAGALAGTGAVVGSGFSVGANWLPTLKITVSANYSLTDSKYESGGATGSVNSNLREVDQLSTLKLTYQALQWLRVSPFASYEDRQANIAIDGFNAAIFGIDVRISLGDAANVK